MIYNRKRNISFNNDITPLSIIKLDKSVIVNDFVDEDGNVTDIIDNKDKSYSKRYSSFSLDLCKFIYNFYNPQKLPIIDPFAGWGERHYVAKKLKISYSGIDLSTVAINYAKNIYNVENVNADARNIPFEDYKFGFCLTCPPYFNKEKYDGTGINISDYTSYIQDMLKVFKEVKRVLIPGSLFCIAISDIRKDGVFYDVSSDFCTIISGIGFSIHDKVIIDNSANYNISQMINNSVLGVYTPKVHEYILIFKIGV